MDVLFSFLLCESTLFYASVLASTADGKEFPSPILSEFYGCHLLNSVVLETVMER